MADGSVAEGVARQVLDSTSETVNNQRIGGVVANGAAEGEHVGAVANNVCEVAPTGREFLGGACDFHNLLENQGNIEGVSFCTRNI